MNMKDNEGDGIMEERTVSRIILEYEDTSTREISKGFVAQFTENDNDTITSTFDMVGMSGKDLEMLVYSVIELGAKLGLFGKEYQ